LLTFIPTPIGNLEDISFRTIKEIEKADIVLCEDTRVTKRFFSLLKSKFEIETNYSKIISIHSHNEKEFIENIHSDFFNQNIIYLTDAGMPAISDPGAILVDYCIKNKIKYDVLPGANALLTAYAMSGIGQIDKKEFIFYGFLNHKSVNREEELKKILNLEFPTILYEAPHRIIKLIEEIIKIDNERELFLVKEISKLHQRYFKDKAKNILTTLKESNIKGEWVVIIEANKNTQQNLVLNQNDILKLDIQPKLKAKMLSKITDKNTSYWYKKIIS